MEKFEQKHEKFFPLIHDGNWTNEVLESTPEKLTVRQSLELGDRKIEERGIYSKIHLTEFGQDFFVLDEQAGTPGCLPHGTACYIDEWDVVLVRADSHGIDLREPLSKKSFTILAHELGHRGDYQKTNAEQMRELSYEEKETRAWQIAKQLFGDNPKFDHDDANRDIESY